MKYEIRYTQITNNGCCQAYSREFDSEDKIEEMTTYNKKLRCFMTIESVEENENEGKSTRKRARRSDSGESS